jgi:hypothetical protein
MSALNIIRLVSIVLYFMFILLAASRIVPSQYQAIFVVLNTIVILSNLASVYIIGQDTNGTKIYDES